MNKRIMKVITLILSCLLLIGAAVGITVAAEENDPSVTIHKKNIAYEGAIQLVYLVEANNLPDGAIPAIQFAPVGKAAYVKKANGTVNLSGVEYASVYSDGIVAKEYRLGIVATPGYLIGEEFTAAGAAATFSAFDYAMARFDGTYSAKQFDLYKALLDYGAAVQEVLGYNNDTVANLGGWIDEYYQITVNGVANNKRGDFNGILETARFNAEGEGFTGWTDEEGKTVVGWTALPVKPGTTVLNANYAPLPEGTETFDAALTQDSAVKFVDYSDADDKVTATVENGYVNLAKDDKQIDGSKLVYQMAGAYATQYIYETDFNINYWDMNKNEWLHKFAMWGAGNAELFNSTIYKSGSKAKIGDYVFDLNTWHHIKMVLTINDNGTYTTASYVDGYKVSTANQAALQNGVDFKAVTAGVQMRDSSYHDCYNVDFFMDNTVAYTVGEAVTVNLPLDSDGGEGAETVSVTYGQAYTLPTPVNGNAPFLGWYYGDKLVAQSGTWTIFGTKAISLKAKWGAEVTVALNANGGECAEDSIKLYAGQAYELPAASRTGLIFGGWFTADDEYVAPKGTWPIDTETEIALTAKWYVKTNGTLNDFSINKVVNGSLSGGTYADGKAFVKGGGWDVNTWFSIGGGSVVYSGNTPGTKYVFEGNFTYEGNAPVATNADSTQLGFIGFTSTAINSNEHMYYYNYILGNYDDANGDGKCDYVTIFDVKFPVGVSKNVRYEYIVGTAAMQVYVNGEFSHTFELTKMTSEKITANQLDPTDVCKFMYVWRSCSKGIEASFDNVYVGMEAPSVESSFTLDATYGTLPEGTDVKYTYLTGEDYELPIPTAPGLTFGGWYAGNNAVLNSGKWSSDIGADAVLTAKWIINENKTFTDYGDVTRTQWSDAIRYQFDANNSNIVPAGTKYTFAFTYTYKGLSAFTLDTATGAVTGNGAEKNYGFVRLYNTAAPVDANIVHATNVGVSGDFVNANGDVVVKDGKLIENSGITADTQIFYSKISWMGLSFEIGEEYDIVIEVFMNGEGNKPTILITATDESGASRSAEQNANGAVAADGTHIGSFAFVTRNAGTYSLKQNFKDAKLDIGRPTFEAQVTLNVNGGTLPDGSANTITLVTGMNYTLPTPTAPLSNYQFAGWYNGDNLVANSGKWGIAGEVNLVAKWKEVFISGPYDITINNTNSHNFQPAGYSASKVDPDGTVYIFTSEYTYGGMNAFTGEGTEASPLVPYSKVEPQYIKLYGIKNDGTGGETGWAAVSKASGSIVDANGNVAAVNGVLKEGYTKDKVYLSQLSWCGLTFKIGVTYKLTMTFTKTNGAITVVVTATDPDGNTKTSTSVTSVASKLNTLKYFRFEGRSYSNACGSANNVFTITNTFNNTTFNTYVPVEATITSKNVVDVNGKSDPVNKFVKDTTYDANKVDPEGTIFSINTKYTYKGIGGVFTINPDTYEVTSRYTKGDFAYIGFYTKNSNGTRLRYSGLQLATGCKLVTADGKVVVDENGILLKEYQDLYKAGEFDASKIFYSKITWGGVSFEIGKTYDLTLTYTCGKVTYNDEGVATTAAIGPATITAVLDGVVQNGSGFTASAAHFNVQGFSFYWRGADTVQSGLGSYTADQSFTNTTITVVTPIVE